MSKLWQVQALVDSLHLAERITRQVFVRHFAVVSFRDEVLLCEKRVEHFHVIADDDVFADGVLLESPPGGDLGLSGFLCQASS